MSVTPTPLPMWMDRPLSHTSVHTYSEGGRVGYTHTTHTDTCVSPATCAHHMHVHTKLQPGGVVKCGTLVQVAMTDLEDVVDGGGQRLAYGGYV